MKETKKVFWGLVFSVMLLLMQTTVSAAEPLDEIEKEIIWIDMQSDGSMNIMYEIDWKVLDSTSDGPLSWIKIGIPNEYVEELTPLSDSIDEIRYYDSGGEYVRLDLDREYYARETVRIKFSIHQHRMYKEVQGGYEYRFIPGWFDDIAIKELMIYWKYDKETISDMSFANEEESYFAHYQKLQPAERVEVEVFYPEEIYQFHDDYKKSVSPAYSYIRVLAVISGVFGIMVYASVLYIRRNHKEIKDSYERNRGLGNVYVSSRRRRGGSSHGGGCACACAGGGRAGCSRKDFFRRVRVML